MKCSALVTRTSAIGLIGALACALAIGACGNAGPQPASAAASAPAGQLSVYSSLPLDTAAGQAVGNGLKLGLEVGGSRIGTVQIAYRGLGDGSLLGPWNADQTVANASRAATDPYTGFYVGEMHIQADRLSSPILDQATIAQLSPTTGPVQDTTPNVLNFEVPTATQAKLVAQGLLQAGCSRVVIAAPSTVAPVNEMRSELASALGVHDVRVLANKAVSGFAANEQALSHGNQVNLGTAGFSGANTFPAIDIFGTNFPGLPASRSSCMVATGLTTTNVVRLSALIHRQSRHVRIFGMVASCTARGAQLLPSLACVSQGLPLSSYPGTAALASEYASRFGQPASAAAVYGYAAAELFDGAVTDLGMRALDRGVLLASLSSTRGDMPVLQSYTFAKHGRTSISFLGLRPLPNVRAGRSPTSGVTTVTLSVL